MKGRWVLSTAIAIIIASALSVAVLAQTPGDPRYYKPGGGDFQFAHPTFQLLWNRIDLPYRNQKVNRTWFWGPAPNSVALLEPYRDVATGRTQRLVQYFDKNRMEVNNPTADSSNPFQYVSNGLLSVELISGQMQVGTDSYIAGNNACISMAGDAGDNLAPTYYAFRGVSNTRLGDHNAVNRTGQKPTETIDRNGKVGNDFSKANFANTNFVHYENKHNIPKVFWDFLNASGPVYTTNGQLTVQQIINPWYFASGLPISEPYWARAIIAGKPTDVMIQAYERGIFTYTPSNLLGWQVEMGNIGQHYFNWRYTTFGLCPGVTTVVPPQVLVTTNPTAPFTSTPTPPIPPTPIPPTATRIVVGPPTPTQPIFVPPTNTPIPTSTNIPTAVGVPPTATVRPPTLTPTHTNVPVPPKTSTPTATRIPTNTRTPTEPPTPSETNTRVPTSTNTKTPTKTPTPSLRGRGMSASSDCFN